MSDDYISRQKTLDEAQRIRRNLQMLDNTQAADKMLYGVWRLEIEIEKLPAEPVQEVVHCQDCVFGYQYFDVQNDITDNCVECRNPDGLHRDVSMDEFCSVSIRR